MKNKPSHEITWPFLAWAVLTATLAGCAASADGGASDSSSTASSAESSTGDVAELTHGAITLEFRRAAGQTSNPFLNVATVDVTMVYQDCLTGFYDANPNFHQDGLVGARVFGADALGGEGWLDRLCAAELPTSAECTVESITQTLAVAHLLNVRYTLAADLENRTLQFGPIPTAQTAGCVPVMRMTSAGTSKGFDAGGMRTFVVESSSPNDGTTDQATAMVLEVAVAP